MTWKCLPEMFCIETCIYVCMYHMYVGSRLIKFCRKFNENYLKNLYKKMPELLI